MLTPISTKIEEFKKIFINIGSLRVPMDGSIAVKFVEREKEVIDFLTTALEQRDNEWRELVEGKRKELESEKPILDLRLRQGKAGALYEWNRNENKIEALDDIITKSKEI